MDAVRAQAVSYEPELRGYAQVTPVQLVTIKVGLAGVLEDLAVQPGESLSRGEVVARLGGADQVKAMADARARLAAAEETFAAATDAQQSVRGTYGLKLSDRARLDRAKADLAAATAQVTDAKAELARLQALSTIVSPVSGRVISLSAANGERLAKDGPVLVLQPDHDLWLKAVFYDAPMTLLTAAHAARFLPATGAKALPVRLVQVLPSVRPDGGITAFFEGAAGGADWRGGEAGEVVLVGEPRQAVAIPTAALVLDQGRWWVLAKTDNGLRRQAVVPGPSRGEQTIILHGLAAGEAVVVRDVYARFHRDFGQHYTPPD
jgi:RND family efflux transporter MFP subunit